MSLQTSQLRSVNHATHRSPSKRRMSMCAVITVSGIHLDAEIVPKICAQAPKDPKKTGFNVEIIEARHA